MKLRSILLTFGLMLAVVSVSAQDIHFSQYYASPLTLNPALTGKFNGLWRATAIYRDQWRPIVNSNAYMTPSASVDFSLLKNKLKTDALGVGAVMFYDKAGNFQTMKAALSVAYHKGLDKEGKYNLSLGLQGIYSNRKIDPTFTFGENLAFVPTFIDNDRIANVEANHNIDMNMGLFFDGKITDWMTVYTGYSFMNLMRHKNGFLPSTDGDYQTPFRHVAHGGFEFDVKDKFVIIPGVLYQTTAKSREINFGSTFGYKLKSKAEKTTTLFLGGWYRWDSAVIAKGGFDFENFRLTGAYDIGLGQMKTDSKNAVGKLPTAFEVAVSYFGIGRVPSPTDRYLFNPRF
jgi:type IX secretion system PorP/SprF family membrane protein